LQDEFNGSLKLAKTLKPLGNKLFYLGIPDSKGRVRMHIFLFMPIIEKWFLNGFFKQKDLSQANNAW
jgi:zeaxanthin glucosyltransferase